jgi:hypothetical protein
LLLVNLVRKRHESDHGENPQREFAERACVLSSDSQSAIAHWEAWTRQQQTQNNKTEEILAFSST